MQERARLYLGTIPGAVAGQRGHDRTFYAAGRLVRGFGLDPDAAYPLFAEWNQKCDPQWSEHDLRRKLEQAARQPGPRGFLLGSSTTSSYCGTSPTGRPKVLRNYFMEEVPDGDTMRKVPRGRPLPAVAAELAEMSFGWPKRVGDQLFVLGADGEPLYLQTTEALFAWIGRILAPENAKDGDPVDWSGRCGVSKSEFRAYLQQNAERYDSIELTPHEPPIDGVYYVPRPLAGGDGKALAELLKFFCPATAEDGDLLEAFAMSLLWGGEAGQRPAWLFTGEDGDDGRGIGKTKAVEYISKLVGGHMMVLQNEEFGGVVTRLLSPEASGRRVVLIDNIKSTNFSWGELEGFVTAGTVSGRALYRGEGSKPNHYTVALTGNRLGVSRDVSQRVLVVKLCRPSYGTTWNEDINRFIAEKRWEILGDLVAALQRPKNQITLASRLGAWQGGVLARLPDPDAVQRILNERSANVDNESEEVAEVVEAVSHFLRNDHCLNPSTVVVLIDSAVMAKVVGPVFGSEYKGTSQVNRKLNSLHIRQIHKARLSTSRCWQWNGANAPTAATPTYRITGTGKEPVGSGADDADL